MKTFQWPSTRVAPSSDETLWQSRPDRGQPVPANAAPQERTICGGATLPETAKTIGDQGETKPDRNSPGPCERPGGLLRASGFCHQPSDSPRGNRDDIKLVGP